MPNEKSLANLRPVRNDWSKSEASLFGKIGGSRKTLAKRKSAILASISQRKCITCPYLDVCYVGLSALSSSHIQKAWDEGDKTLAHQIKCRLPGWTLKNLADIMANPDFNEVEKSLFSRMLLGADDFYKQDRLIARMCGSMWKNKINFQLTKEQKDIKIEVEFVGRKSNAENSGNLGDKKAKSIGSIDANTSGQ